MEEKVSPSSLLETAATLSSAALRELQERTKSALAASRVHATRLEADITRQLDEIASTIREHIAAESQSDSQSADYQSEITRLTAELKTSKADWANERKSLEAERNAAAAQAEELETRNRASQDEWRNQLLGFESRLREQHTAWNEQRAEWTATRTALETERDELQQKFELALQDIQRLRERVAEMEHDLARRPAADQTDSAELVALRAERDALHDRVTEFEQRPAAQIDADTEQSLADLQRRFELAVEDVRELKTKNAKLESQLAAASSRPTANAVDTGGTDWESQKRRLLASLEETAEDENDAELAKERATIAGTIEITDAVVAEKDRLLAEMSTELEALRYRPVGNEEARSQKINDLIDSDAVINQHRERSQQLEREIEQKLRTAELELSVERAKMARQKAELEELRANLEAERQLFEANGGVPTPGAPKRRWLSKLGIDAKDKE
ncbi:MAG TPA: hypothetical protein VHU84_06395 [Lacipirellulaceae bacterium]|jgi:chromosome segregation ATPase|nr:hypothetical protein [Lacipirellulaceae bacterium]